MKVIDLLNKIANGENIKNIKYQNHIYEYFNGDFREEFDGVYDSNWLFANEIIDLSNLNDEVEIIEEEKKLPEKIKIDNEDRIQALSTGNFVYKVNQPTKNIIYKINEIIDYLQSKGE